MKDKAIAGALFVVAIAAAALSQVAVFLALGFCLRGRMMIMPRLGPNEVRDDVVRMARHRQAGVKPIAVDAGVSAASLSYRLEIPR